MFKIACLIIGKQVNIRDLLTKCDVENYSYNLYLTNSYNGENLCEVHTVEIPKEMYSVEEKQNYLYTLALESDDNDFFVFVYDTDDFKIGWEDRCLDIFSKRRFIGIILYDSYTVITRKHSQIFRNSLLYSYSTPYTTNHRHKPLRINADDINVLNTYLKKRGTKIVNYYNTDYSKIMKTFSEEYTKSVIFDYDLIFNSNLTIYGFQENDSKNTITKNYTLPILSVSEINTYKHQAYKYLRIKDTPSFNEYLVIAIKDPKNFDGLEQLIQSTINKWSVSKVALFSTFSLLNYRPLSIELLPFYLKKAIGCIYDINNYFAYELCIKYKIEHIIELKPLYFNIVNYSTYFLPHSYDLSKKVKIPSIVGLLNEDVKVPTNTDIKIYIKKDLESEKEFFLRVLKTESHMLLIRESVIKIPSIDFNYVLGLDYSTQVFLYIGTEKIIELVFNSSFSYFNLPVFFI